MHNIPSICTTLGIRQLITDNRHESLKEAAGYLGMRYMTLYKIMNKTNRPTADHGILLCNKGGFSATGGCR